MTDFKYKVTCTGFPLQIEGTIDGVPFYFRARYDEWGMGIGGSDPASPVMAPAWSMVGPWGEKGSSDASTMEEAAGIEIVKRCAELWRALRALEAGTSPDAL